MNEEHKKPPLELNEDIHIQDCKTPACIAHQLSNTIMLAKANTGFSKLFILGFLAGVYVGFGGEVATLISQDTTEILGSGITRVLSGSVFTVALVLIIIAGGELFTGNTMILLSLLEKQTTLRLLLRNWYIVYASNFLGAVFIILILYFTNLWTQNNLIAAATGLKIAVSKVNLTFVEAFTRGLLANWLVCLAIWMSVASRQVVGKILAVFFPIMTFAAVGYEHCIANMFFITKGLFLKTIPEVTITSGISTDKLESLSVSSFIINNLVPVTLGNVFGAVIFVVLLYWFVYLKNRKVNV